MLWDAIATHIYRIQVTFNLTCSLKYPVLWSTTNGSSSWSPIITNVDMHLSSFPRTYNFLNFSVYLPSPQQTLLTNQGERYILRLLVFWFYLILGWRKKKKIYWTAPEELNLMQIWRIYNFLNLASSCPVSDLHYQQTRGNPGKRYILRLLVFLILPNIRMKKERNI